jgi:hypothetical protein
VSKIFFCVNATALVKKKQNLFVLWAQKYINPVTLITRVKTSTAHKILVYKPQKYTSFGLFNNKEGKKVLQWITERDGDKTPIAMN